jgi:hypothetical protein
MKSPFQASSLELEANLDAFVDAVFGALKSEFLTLPRGNGFIEYSVFEEGYEALKQATAGFRDLSPAAVTDAVYRTPMTFIVIRAVLGFTPPEWAYVASQTASLEISQGFIRSLDRRIRLAPLEPIEQRKGLANTRIKALVDTACQLISSGAAGTASDAIHRLDKADTKHGLASLQPLADLGAPYAMLLYERFLGRPFAGHRDSVSELVGDVLETAIEEVLSRSSITYRKTKRAEKISGFDQSPDFIIPDEFNPKVIIEAKITEDDGTARDKITRVQHLYALSMRDVPPGGKPRFEVIACIAGRGFKVRREDMKKLLLATRGKVFTLQNVDKLVDFSRLRDFRTRR